MTSDAPAPDYETIRLSRGDLGTWRLTLARPEKLNSINERMQDEIVAAIDWIARRTTANAVVITGEGRAFMAGADIGDYGSDSLDAFREFQQRGARLYAALRDSRLVSVAAVNGYALGGGLELVLACDVAMAAEGALFGLPEVKLGLVPGGGGLSRLARTLPPVARYLVLTGRSVDAVRMEQWGLVQAVVPGDTLLAEADSLAERLDGHASETLAVAKRRLSAAPAEPAPAALAADIDALVSLFDSEVGREGVSAFNEKRRPEWPAPR